jgi:hypothetical protein
MAPIPYLSMAKKSAVSTSPAKNHILETNEVFLNETPRFDLTASVTANRNNEYIFRIFKACKG